MSEWSQAKLGETATIITGGTPKTAEPSYWDGDVVWVTPKDVTALRGRFISSSERTITSTGLQASAARLLPARTVLVSARGTVGSCAIAETPLATNQSMFALVPSEDVLAEWLYFWVRANRDAFLDRSAGNVFAAISASTAADIAVRLPPLDEQREMVSVLAAASDAVVAAQAHLDALVQLRISMRIEAFDTMKAPRKRLSEVGTFARGGSFPKAEQGRSEGDHPVFKVADMNALGNERRLFTPENWVTDEQLTRLRMKTWPAGTVVFPRVGAALAGDRRRLLTRKSVLDDNMLGLTPAAEQLRPYFLLLALEGVGMAAMAQHGAVPSINAKMVGAIEVPVPALEEQDALIERFTAVDSATDGARAHFAATVALRGSLERDLIHGVVRVGEADDAETAVA